MRRDFQLPEEDAEYVESLGLPWETVKSGETRWLLVHNWPVPTGYNHAAAVAGLMLPASYPDGQIDMAYFHPHLALLCGKGIKNLTAHSFDGKEWQQWSRHRTGENPWRPGVDNVATHFLLVQHWLKRELPGCAA
jgi:hypothetical protein